jgi:hypothetical protein
LHHNNSPSHTFLFTGEFFLPKTTWLSSPSTLLSSVSPIENKTERPPFWHIWGDRGRKCRRCRTPSEHDFQDALTNGNSARVMVVSRPKVSLWPDGSTSPKKYGWLCMAISSKLRKNTIIH